LFDSQRPVTIVVADTSLVVLQNLTRQTVPLADYSDGSYLTKLAKRKPELAQALIASPPRASMADVVLTARLVQSATAQQRTVIIRHARDLRMRDLEDGRLIFLGSAYSNPWLRLFDEERNFTLGEDEPTRVGYLLNKSPQAKEQGRYYARSESNGASETYGLITYVPNLRHTDSVLILEGISSEGTEAAGDFVTDPRYGAQLAQYLILPGDKSILPYFQLLLKVTALNNTPSVSQVIAHRVSPNFQQVR